MVQTNTLAVSLRSKDNVVKNKDRKNKKGILKVERQM